VRQETIRQLIESTGVTINGPNPWDIQVKDERWYARVWREQSLGLGESYMEGWWECERLDELFHRLLCGGIENNFTTNWRTMVYILPWVVFNLQSKARAHIIAEHHYDLDNDLFLSFLDPYNQYSCGYFEDTKDLNQAQLKKMALIAGKLSLSTADHVLDIGCGWGGLARYMAERFGCSVTAVNISREQLSYAREFCRDLPVTILDCDYRSINGRFNKIVSVGMFEHVGSMNYKTFMKMVHRCLDDHGIFLLHTIGSNQTVYTGGDPWLNKYIFPNGILPSIDQIALATEGLFVMEDWHNLGPHYDKTLMAWNDNFQHAWPALSSKYNTQFKRMWEYYLLSCAGIFRARGIQLWQIVMTKYGVGTPQPSCRILPEMRG